MSNKNVYKLKQLNKIKYDFTVWCIDYTKQKSRNKVFSCKLQRVVNYNNYMYG